LKNQRSGSNSSEAGGSRTLSNFVKLYPTSSNTAAVLIFSKINQRTQKHSSQMAHRFTAVLDIIGANPFVHVPEPILEKLFIAAARTNGPIPIKGSVNGNAYQQTLVRFRGAWRLYVNLSMLPRSPQRVGEHLAITIGHDPADRSIEMPPTLEAGLKADSHAAAVFTSLRPSLQKEIMRYIGNLKSEEAVNRNVQRAIDFLNGKGRFAGRDNIAG